MAKPKSNKMKRQEKKDKAKKPAPSPFADTFAAKKALEEKRIAEAKRALIDSRANSRNPSEVIKAIYKGEKIHSSSPYKNYEKMFAALDKNKKALFEILSHCANCGVHFKDVNPPYGTNGPFTNALIGLAIHSHKWIRPVEEWKPNSYNTYRQFSSLVRHLFAKYYVPSFFDSAFYSGNMTHQEWFIHVGIGHNIRQANNLPFVLTKKAAHHMMTAPSDFDVLSALRWGQIKFLGGDERLVRAVLRTRVGNNFSDHVFWESVFRWFRDNPMLDTAHYAPVIDFLYNQKFVPSIPNEAAEGPRLLPPQPNLSMKHRTVESTLKAVEEWHKQTGRNRDPNAKYWNSSGIPEFFYEEGENNKKIYTVTELLSASELKEEGNAMYHCVGSYSNSCSAGRISVWSMKVSTKEGLNRMLTIEVNNGTRTITQARGKYNAIPKAKEVDIMGRWASAAKLRISQWLI